MKPVSHQVTGTLIEVLEGSVVKIRQAPEDAHLSVIDHLPVLRVNLRNHHRLPDLSLLVGKPVEVSISSLPENETDVVYGSLKRVINDSGERFFTDFRTHEQQPLPELAIREFAREWTRLEKLPSHYSAPAQVTFLFTNYRYTETTNVELELRENGGSIRLPDSSVLHMRKLPRLFDTLTHTFSLRNGGALCVIGQGEKHEDFVFWINVRKPKPRSLSLTRS